MYSVSFHILSCIAGTEQLQWAHVMSDSLCKHQCRLVCSASCTPPPPKLVKKPESELPRPCQTPNQLNTRNPERSKYPTTTALHTPKPQSSPQPPTPTKNTGSMNNCSGSSRHASAWILSVEPTRNVWNASLI